MKQLTRDQRDKLFQLIEYQRQSKTDMVFFVAWGDIYSEEPGEETEPVIKADYALIASWSEGGYVTLFQGAEAKPMPGQLRLTPSAIGYYNRMRKPWLLRQVLGIFDLVKDQWKGILVGIIIIVLGEKLADWLI